MQELEVVFENHTTGAVIPKEFLPAIERGIRAALKSGVLAGYPVGGLRVKLTGGSFHKTDSSELAFETAAALAVQKAVMAAGPVLMEPVVRMTLEVPTRRSGKIIADLASRRGRLVGVAAVADNPNVSVITALVPLSEVLGYTTQLRSLTEGKGSYGSSLDHYEKVPQQVTSALVGQKLARRLR